MRFSKYLPGLALGVLIALSNASYADVLLDEVPPGSLGTWTYEPADPCSGNRNWSEVTSVLDGTTAIQTEMSGCGWTCGSFNLHKEFPFAAPIDRNAVRIRFDAVFDLLNSISHNRAQVQFQFYKNGTYLGYVRAGYDRFGEAINVPAGVYAEGTWELDISTLPDDPDLMKVVIHTRSCVSGNGRVVLDNIALIGHSDPTECDGATAQIQALEASLADASATIADLNEETIQQASEILVLQAEVNNLGTEVSNLEAEIGDLEGELSDLETAVADLEDENSQLSDDLNEAGAGLSEISSLISTPQGLRGSTSDYIGGLGGQLNEVVDKLLAPPGQSKNKGKGN